MDYTKLLSIDSEGKPTINESELKKLLQVEGDRRSTEASRTARENAELELKERIRAELEQEAKLSAEEKAKMLISKEMEVIKKEKLNLNREKVENLFLKANIDKEDYEPLLSYVSDDITKSLEVAEKQISSIQKIAEKQYQSRIKENMGVNSTPPVSGVSGQTQTNAKIITNF